MTLSSPSNPFLAGQRITDSRFFVGRQEELERITVGIFGAQRVSINLVGRRLIGKSCLLYHFFQSWEQWVEDRESYVVIYVSLQEARCQREEEFYYAVGQQLWHCPLVQAKAALVEPLRVRPFNRFAFSSTLGNWKRQGVVAVICLDDFEVLLRYPREFNDSFFDNLRSLVDSSALMLVLASHRQLSAYRHRHQLKSSFFQMAQVIPLGEFKDEEAQELVCLPRGKIPDGEAALSKKEQKLVLQLGGCHPFLLQLAASLLWEARQQGRDVNWAKSQFELEARRVPGYSFNPRQGKHLWRLLFWLPLTLGRFVRGVRGTVDEVGNLLTGLMILMVVMVAVVGVLNWQNLLELLQGLLGR